MPDERKTPTGASRIVLYLFVFLGVAMLLSLLIRTPKAKKVEWSEFLTHVSEGFAEEVLVRGRTYTVKLTEGAPKGSEKCRAIGPPYGDLSDADKAIFGDARKKGVKISYEKDRELWQILIMFSPYVLIIFVLYMFWRMLRAGGGGGGVLSFGKSRATLVTKEKTDKSFADVAGIEEAKEEVKEIIEFLKNPKRFQRLGGRIPKGVLLIGPPGTGKTLLAKAIAGEANVPFFSISGSDFVEMFVGVGASRVRDLFQQAKDNSPCIIFLDEIDAVGRRRGTGLGGGHDEREQTLNAILVEMDGFGSDEKVIVMAATNRPDVLDPALLRQGRFDRRIAIDLPDIRGREAILKVHAKRIKLAPEINFQRLAKATPMFSGADLEGMINEAALLATMEDKDAVEMADLEEARDKVLWGREKKSRVMDEEDRSLAAYHESGHALAASLVPEADELHKVTIIPRGMFLGATFHLPRKDIYNKTRKKLLGEMVVFYAGRAAEEVFCRDVSTGARNDIEQATELARKMVCHWGMSEKLGPVSYSAEQEHLFLGREIARVRDHSEETSVEIDKEVKRIVEEAYAEAKKLIEANKDGVERIARALLKYEVLAKDDVDKLIAGASVEELAKKEA